MGEDLPQLERATVVIVGLGLVGGSLGLALKRRCLHRIGVVAAGDEATAATALQHSVVDEITALDDAAARANIVVLATPVNGIVQLVPQVAAKLRPGALLTDVGSVKRGIVEAMAVAGGLGMAVGGHPMAGGTAGLDRADASLFAGAVWTVCEVPGQPPAAAARLAGLVTAIGARPVSVDAAEHDIAAAYISHLPYAMSQALMRLYLQCAHDVPAVSQLAAKGFAGATRMAGGDTRMWAEILQSNRAALLEAIDGLGRTLAELSTHLGSEDSLIEWLDAGASARRSLD